MSSARKWSEGEPAKPPAAMPLVEGARRDLVLLGPDGSEIVRIKDRPWLGYERDRSE